MSLPRSRSVDSIRSGRRDIGELAPSVPTGSPQEATSVLRRRAGTTRLALDVPDSVLGEFKRRAHARRFSQTEALHGALLLLAGLGDDEYEALLEPLRPSYE